MCECKINNLMKKETGASILLYPSWLLTLSTLLIPLLSFLLGLRPLLPQNCRLPQTSASEIECTSRIVLDMYPLLSCNFIVKY